MSGQKRLTAPEYEIPTTLSQKQLATLQVLRQTAAILRVEMTPLEVQTWGTYLEQYSLDEIGRAFNEWVAVGNGRYPKPSKITEFINRYRNENVQSNRFVACGLEGCDDGWLTIYVLDEYNHIANYDQDEKRREWAGRRIAAMVHRYGTEGAEKITAVKECPCRKKYKERIKGAA